MTPTDKARQLAEQMAAACGRDAVVFALLPYATALLTAEEGLENWGHCHCCDTGKNAFREDKCSDCISARAALATIKALLPEPPR